MMRVHHVALTLLFGVLRATGSSQTPLQRPNASANDRTANLIFTSVGSLLQQWPNTLFRNGHTVIQGQIPSGTILYHGRGDPHVPSHPEWLAFNFEHSYLLCHGGESWMLTLATKRDLNILYFDGSSASNSILGHLDSQDVLMYGRVRPDKLLAEPERIMWFCKWGEPFGIDAIVRMEPGFEVMLCDFTTVELVAADHIIASTNSTENLKDTASGILGRRQKVRRALRAGDSHDDSAQSVTMEPPSRMPPGFPPIYPPDQPFPPGWHGPLRSAQSTEMEVIQAAFWNAFYPGEARVKLDYTRMISFYDPRFESLVESRQNQPSRNHHRLTGISRDDQRLAKTLLEEDLGREKAETSAVDWSMLLRMVTDRYAERLYQLQFSLSQLRSSASTPLATRRVREQVLVMLTPYIHVDDVPPPLQGEGGRSWVFPIRDRCAATLMKGVQFKRLVRSEKMIKNATEHVLWRICTTLTEIWADAMSSLEIPDKEQQALLGSWYQEVESLMKWLDWPMWHVCRPACPDESFCYIPTWPWGVEWFETNVDTIDMTPRQTNLQQIDETHCTFALEAAENINHICVFMLGTVPFPPGYAATVHFYWPGKGFQLLGMLSNEKPSAIFRVRGTFGNAQSSVSASHQIILASTQNQPQTATTAQLGIAIEPVDTVQSQISTLQSAQLLGTSKPLTDPVALAEGIGKHLMNYLSSFGQSGPDGQTYVPIAAVGKWYESFMHKVKAGGIGFLERQE